MSSTRKSINNEGLNETGNKRFFNLSDNVPYTSALHPLQCATVMKKGHIAAPLFPI